MKISYLLLVCVSIGCYGAALAKNWGGFYDQQTLTYWSQQMPPDIQKNLNEVIWPALTPTEQRALTGVALSFPLENKNHPMNFYETHDGQNKTIHLPISSLRFLADLTLASAWLNRNGYSQDTITDYLAMLKYQWPGQFAGKPYYPLDALGLPRNVRSDPAVYALFQKAFGTSVVFILAHELGHIYHRHPNYESITPAVARYNETEADKFALEIMRRIGTAPSGISLFFYWLAHLELYQVDQGTVAYRQSLESRTHPLTSDRMTAIANAIEGHKAGYAKSAPDARRSAELLMTLTKEINIVAEILKNTTIQEVIKQRGVTATPNSLAPHRSGLMSAPPRKSSGLAFDGSFNGKWINVGAKVTEMDAEMTLNRRGDEVTGSYTFGASNESAGIVVIRGYVYDNCLHFDWKWGKEYFGKGVLKIDPSSRIITGTWGYTKSESGGGNWKLQRIE